MILMIDNYDSFTTTKEKPTEGGFITTQLIESALTQSSTYFHNQTDHWYYHNAMPHNHPDEPELHQIHEFQSWQSRCYTHYEK